MGWETRANGQYYYSKTWSNGTCVSQYIGNGYAAQLAARLDELNQQRRQFERDQRQAELDRANEIDRTIEYFSRAVGQMVAAVLLAAGYHQHKREWRKKRMAKVQKEDGTEVLSQLKEDAAKFLAQLQRGKGKQEDEERFRTVIKEAPTLLKSWDLVRLAQISTIKEIAGVNKALEIANLELLKNIKQELGYDDASTLEKLIIDQIALCHIRLYWFENLFNTNSDIAISSTARGINWEKRLTINQRRYFRAVETLAKVRRLARRTPEILQVNIAENQVNQVGQT